MRYSENSKRLKDNMANNRFAMDGALMEEFRTAPEETRVRILKQVFNDCIADYETIPLWADGSVPGYNDEYELQNKPQVAFFPGDGEGRKGCVIVAPGGGYNCKASSSEGYPVIEKLNRAGISAALLDYRVKPYTQYFSLLDMQRAIRLIRHMADELNIFPDRIGVNGGSAGGNLSCLASVHFDGGNPDAADPVERVSSRPDTAVISYGTFTQVSFPVITPFIKTDDKKPPQGAGLVSCYMDTDREKHFFFSPEKHVTPDTPPFFLWQTCDNDDPRQMFAFAKELADAGVRFEAHIFPFGPHGMGLADGSSQIGGRDEHVMHWMELAVEWLKIYKF